MVNSQLHRLTATEVLALTRPGKLSVEDYAKALLARIEKRDPVVHAWVYLDPELVLAQARQLDQIPAGKRGPLHGLAIGIKVIDVSSELSSRSQY
jgi:Asp-tRNA(Asn)/Glu-tRNA(Gln) amidotransferase A subunit family amidase